MDGVIFENDTKTIEWTENISFVFGAKILFSKLSELVWTGLLHMFKKMNRRNILKYTAEAETEIRFTSVMCRALPHPTLVI